MNLIDQEPYRRPGAPALDFIPATRDLVCARQLLHRIDMKFVVPAAVVVEILGGVARDYAALHVSSGIWASYRSLYFDTQDLRCFHDHRRGRRVRHKVRIRHYPDRHLTFLEVKTKRNEHVTHKTRLELPYMQETLGDRERTFVRETLDTHAMTPVARIDYRRLSLIGIVADERVTIDQGLEIAMPEGTARPLGPFAVIEVKQAKLSASSPMMQRLVGAGHKPRSLSKYVAAIAQLRPAERKNRLLPALRAVERIER
ncbi:MAG TPA: polyphosphate polymerase domain-containing protein [Kofleriaceae bacterium]|nr:polyphosphate polymerase domain-containing protein [Kofleriaceae bacterium]